MKKSFFKVTLLLIVLSSVLSPFSTVSAQEDKLNYFGIIINPAIIFLEANPGETITDVVRLTNDFQERDPSQPNYIGTSKVIYYPSSLVFQQSGEEGIAQFVFDSNLPYAQDASKWVSFSESSYIIDYGQTVESNFVLQVPTDAQPGGHYFGLVYGDNQGELYDEVSLSKSIAALVFLTVRGDVEKDGKLVEFDTGKNWYEFGPVDFKIRYENTGNVHEVLGGNIFVHKGDITKPIATLTVNERGEKVALPRSVREIRENWGDGFIVKKAEGGYKLNWDSITKIYVGKYKATLKLRHSSNGERVTSEAEISFWMIPWKLIAALVLIITGFVIYFIVSRRKRSKK